jgi:predicted O-methyltransferase YrrM
MLGSLKRVLRGVPGAKQGKALVHRTVVEPARMMSFRVAGGTRHAHKAYAQELDSAIANVGGQSDISDHLGAIFFHAIQCRPRLMVELGTRGGASTRALLAAAAVSDATLLSVDIDDCRDISCPHRELWQFVQDDDVNFALESFEDWCHGRGLAPAIDVLFIDTSHEYAHTCRELAAWIPFVSDGGGIMLHDTNMGAGLYGRTDGSIGFGWDNARGVIRAVEEFLGRRYDETSYFSDYTKGFAVLHVPNCNGFTMLRRVVSRANADSGATS